MRDFRKLEIWKEGISVVKETYKIIKLLPESEKYGIQSQISRAAVSIPSNIAEGCSRSSETDFKRFLEFAIGSAFELETHFVIIIEMEIIPKEILKSHIQQINQLQKKINALINKLKQSINNK